MKLLMYASIILSCTFATKADAQELPRPRETWENQLQRVLPTFGHRNWIVVVDMAYPAQSRAGIETVYIGGQQLEAVRKVLAAVEKAPHVRGIIHVDEELASVPKTDAPGIDQYRAQLGALLKGRDVERIPHEEIIAKLDEAAKTFRILVLKTDMTLPYTSVFVQLDCGYWTADKEKRLRDALK